jgi:hypothetical protein
LSARTRLQESRSNLKPRPAAIDLKIDTKERLFWHARQRGGDFLLLPSRRGTYIQNIDFYLWLRRLLTHRQRAQAKKCNGNQKSSKHTGILAGGM